ncbi:MAG: glutamate racemase [Patescibacteria group bacterium]
MVGFFDSGAGGLTVLKAVRARLPSLDVVYLGDTARALYGNQHPEAIQRYTREAAAFLVAQGATIIVIACNTASAVAAEVLRAELTMPVFDVSDASVAEALRVSKANRIGVIGTRTTIASKSHENLLRAACPEATIFTQPTPLLAPLVEERAWRYPEAMRILRRYLKPLKERHIDTLILGCTHYPMIAPQIQRIMGKRVKLVSSADAMANKLAQYLADNPNSESSGTGIMKLFATGDTAHFTDTARWWLGESVRVEKAVLN